MDINFKWVKKEEKNNDKKWGGGWGVEFGGLGENLPGPTFFSPPPFSSQANTYLLPSFFIFYFLFFLSLLFYPSYFQTLRRITI